MNKRTLYHCLVVTSISLFFSACAPELINKSADTSIVPDSYGSAKDTLRTAKVPWREYFTDPYLIALIDTALSNNQELNIVL